MKKRRKHTPEQIVMKLRDADVMLNSGKDVAILLSLPSHHAGAIQVPSTKFFACLTSALASPEGEATGICSSDLASIEKLPLGNSRSRLSADSNRLFRSAWLLKISRQSLRQDEYCKSLGRTIFSGETLIFRFLLEGI